MESPDLPWAKRDEGRIIRRPPEKPSRAAVFFLEYLQSKGVLPGKLIDLGCGTGRNAVFFAQNGFEVHAVDRSDEIIKDINFHGVMPHCHSVTDYWLFEDAYFDFAIDIFCFSEQDEPGRRGFYVNEMLRVLKHGAFVLLSVPLVSYSAEKIQREFEGFKVMAAEESEDRIYGKNERALNVILMKK